ncbi:MAG TPA: DUF4097 family beta strand repeat-containing protein [Dehalococcoidia bacterium]|nr:DUF4097 family beta strand repeat-containing protein [Dehalococcoidia bacterium]
MASQVFEVLGHAEIEIKTRSGQIMVIAESRDDVLLERGADVDVERGDAGRLVFRPQRANQKVQIRCPIGSDLLAATESAAIELRGQLGRVWASTASGGVRIDQAESVSVRTRSGRIEIGEVQGNADIATESGKTDLGSAGGVNVRSTSGRVTLRGMRGPVRVRSVKGRIRVEMLTGDDVSVKSISGAVEVKYPATVRPSTQCRSLSGRAAVETEEGEDCRCEVQTVSGKVKVASSR